jgi:hypothetical protein
VDRQANRPALVGERTRDRLADPPCRVGRKLEAELVVELLDRPDETQVALLNEVEKRHTGLRVIPCDRHHEPEVRLDQAPLRGLVAGVLASGQLTLFLAGQEPPVADLADVELERVVGRAGGVEERDIRRCRFVQLVLRIRLVERRQKLQLRLVELGVDRVQVRCGKRLLDHVGCIGPPRNSRYPLERGIACLMANASLTGPELTLWTRRRRSLSWASVQARL